MKKLLSILLAGTMLISTASVISAAAAENTADSTPAATLETSSITTATANAAFGTQQFCDAVNDYIIGEGLGIYYFPDSPVDTTAPGYKEDDISTYTYIYEGFTPETIKDSQVTLLKETDTLVVFAVKGLMDRTAEETIGEYVFSANNLFSDNNKCGYCVYSGNKVYSIADAVKENIIKVEELADYIPGTVKAEQEVTKATDVAEPSTTNNTETTAPTTEPATTQPTTETAEPATEITAPTTVETQPTTEAIKSGEFTSEDGTYKYRVIVEGNEAFAEFVKLIKSDVTTFSIPDELGGAKVISVRASAFKGLNRLKRVTLGKYVFSIGGKAFKGCSSLSKINLDTVADFGAESFSGCSSLKSIDLTKGDNKDFIIVRNKAFYNCKNLKTVKIYDEAEMGAKAFGFITAKKKVKGFKMVLSTNDSAGDNDYTKNGIGYCHTNNFKCAYNLNSSDTKKLYMWAGFAGKLSVGNKNLSKWKSSNKKIVKIDSKGNFIVLKKGKVTLTATKTNGKKYSRVVSVVNSPKLSESKITVKKGTKYTVKITGKANSVNNKFSKSKIARVTSKKTASSVTVKGVKKGTASLKITVNGVVLKLKVTVR